MSQSTAPHEPITAGTDAVAKLPTPDPTTSNSYSDVAAALPEPGVVLPDTVQTGSLPEIAHDYTIPTGNLEPSTIPYNGSELHWRGWRSKYSTISALYVLAARHYEPADVSRRAVHAVFSPPQADVMTDASVGHWRSKATEIAQENGIRGGMAAFHGYRVKKEVVDTFRSYINQTAYEGTATDVLLWEWIRRGDWRDYVEWGPHVHIVGMCKEMDSFSGNGVFEHLRTFPEYTRDINMNAVSEHRAVAKDIMDHATFRVNDPRPPIDWFGDLQGSQPWAAKQLATDTTIENIREKLINGPANGSLRIMPDAIDAVNELEDVTVGSDGSATATLTQETVEVLGEFLSHHTQINSLDGVIDHAIKNA